MEHPFFAFGMPQGAEWLYILVIVIVLFGADKLPKLARGLGKSLGEFKKAKEDFEKEVHAATQEPEKKPDPAPAPQLLSGNLPKEITPVPASSATAGADLSTKT